MILKDNILNTWLTPTQRAELTLDWKRRLLAIGFKEYAPPDVRRQAYSNYVYPDARAVDRVELADRGWDRRRHNGWYIVVHMDGDARNFQAVLPTPDAAFERASRYPHCAVLHEKFQEVV